MLLFLNQTSWDACSYQSNAMPGVQRVIAFSEAVPTYHRSVTLSRNGSAYRSPSKSDAASIPLLRKTSAASGTKQMASAPVKHVARGRQVRGSAFYTAEIYYLKLLSKKYYLDQSIPKKKARLLPGCTYNRGKGMILHAAPDIAYSLMRRVFPPESGKHNNYAA